MLYIYIYTHYKDAWPTTPPRARCTLPQGLRISGRDWWEQHLSTAQLSIDGTCVCVYAYIRPPRGLGGGPPEPPWATAAAVGPGGGRPNRLGPPPPPLWGPGVKRDSLGGDINWEKE